MDDKRGAFTLSHRLRSILISIAGASIFLYASVTLVLSLHQVDELTQQHLEYMADVTASNLGQFLEARRAVQVGREMRHRARHAAAVIVQGGDLRRHGAPMPCRGLIVPSSTSAVSPT